MCTVLIKLTYFECFLENSIVLKIMSKILIQIININSLNNVMICKSYLNRHMSIFKIVANIQENIQYPQLTLLHSVTVRVQTPAYLYLISTPYCPHEQLLTRSELTMMTITIIYKPIIKQAYLMVLKPLAEKGLRPLNDDRSCFNKQIRTISIFKLQICYFYNVLKVRLNCDIASFISILSSPYFKLNFYTIIVARLNQSHPFCFFGGYFFIEGKLRINYTTYLNINGRIHIYILFILLLYHSFTHPFKYTFKFKV